MVRVFTSGQVDLGLIPGRLIPKTQKKCSQIIWKTGVQSQIELYQRLKKLYLMPPCLTLSFIRYGSRVKWSNPGKGVTPSPTPQCSSYWEGSLLNTLDYGWPTYWHTMHPNIWGLSVKHPVLGSWFHGPSHNLAINQRGSCCTWVKRLFLARIFSQQWKIIEWVRVLSDSSRNFWWNIVSPR